MTATLKLYELSAEYRQALDTLTAQEDLPPEAIADTLAGLAGVWEDKALNVARYIRTLEAEAAAIEAAKQGMEARAKVTRTHAERLREYLKRELQRTGLTPKAPDLALRLQRNPPSVLVDDPARVPDGYRRTETLTTLLKAEIRAALSAGHPVVGARLVSSTRLVIA